MKLSQVVILTLLPTAALTSSPNWFRRARRTDTISNVNAATETPVETSSTFNPSELLDFKAHNPEVYTSAMKALQDLEQEPLCHRTAAQLLMHNCRGIEEIDASNAQSANIQRYHVESFANGLTMCDLERARFSTIPSACIPFGSSALYRAARDKHSELDISQTEVTDCLEALGRDHSHWTTWLSNRDKSVTICRAARLDIEKDQAILVHKQLIELMQQFTSGVEDDLTRLKQNLKASSKVAESFVKDLANQAESGKAKLNIVFETISEDIKGVDSVVKSILNSGNEVLHMFKLSMQTALQGNAAMASKQEQALAVATAAFQQRVGSVNVIVGETEASVMAIQNALQQLVPMVVALHERQNALEEKAQAALSAVINATELLQAHTMNLQQASIKASGINEDLEKAVVTAQTWQDTLSVSTSMPDWVLRAGSPMAALVLGNFGIPRSPATNIVLAGAGIASGEFMVLARHALSPYTYFVPWNALRPTNSEAKGNINMPSPVKGTSETSESVSLTSATESDSTHNDMS